MCCSAAKGDKASSASNRESFTGGPHWDARFVGVHATFSEKSHDFKRESSNGQGYVQLTGGTVGNAVTDLGEQTFTITAWIKRTGTGVTANSGSGRISVIPIVGKGCDLRVISWGRLKAVSSCQY